MKKKKIIEEVFKKGSLSVLSLSKLSTILKSENSKTELLKTPFQIHT